MVKCVGLRCLRVVIIEWTQQGQPLIMGHPGIAVDIGDQGGSQDEETPHYLIIVLRNRENVSYK